MVKIKIIQNFQIIKVILNHFNQKGGNMKKHNTQIVNIASSIFFTISGVSASLTANGLTP